MFHPFKKVIKRTRFVGRAGGGSVAKIGRYQET
jgi:hypothetical protein